MRIGDTHDLRKQLGENARRIRLEHGVKAETVAQEARRQGLKYDIARVSDLEVGKVEAKLDTLVRYAQTLANVTGQPVALADLFEGYPVAALLRGVPIERDLQQADAPAVEIARRLGWPDLVEAGEAFGVQPQALTPYLLAYETTGQADRRAAKILRRSLPSLVRVSVDLWGSSLTDERDRRTKPGATTADLGLVTTDLIDELRSQMRDAL